MSFKGKISLVTGASRGIGRAIAKMLAEHGSMVIGTSTNEKGANDISTYLDSNGKGMILNISKNNSIESFLKKMRSEYGEADILVNNAGITHDSLLMCMQENEWHSVIDTNLTSIFRMSKAMIRSMIKKRYGRIINISSVIASIGNSGQANYAASKAGLIGFSKSLAREVASRGITVNVVSPGFIDTDMTNMLSNNHRLRILSQVPVNRFGDPKDVANAVIFFASDKASYITGETMHVNGGMCMI